MIAESFAETIRKQSFDNFKLSPGPSLNNFEAYDFNLLRSFLNFFEGHLQLLQNFRMKWLGSTHQIPLNAPDGLLEKQAKILVDCLGDEDSNFFNEIYSLQE